MVARANKPQIRIAISPLLTNDSISHFARQSGGFGAFRAARALQFGNFSFATVIITYVSDETSVEKLTAFKSRLKHFVPMWLRGRCGYS